MCSQCASVSIPYFRYSFSFDFLFVRGQNLRQKVQYKLNMRDKYWYLCIYLYIHTILVLTFLGYFYLVFVFNRFNDYLFWSNFQLAFVTFYIQSLFLLLFLCVLSQRKDCVIRKVCLIFPITQGPSQYFCYDFEVLEQKEAKEN